MSKLIYLHLLLTKLFLLQKSIMDFFKLNYLKLFEFLKNCYLCNYYFLCYEKNYQIHLNHL